MVPISCIKSKSEDTCVLTPGRMGVFVCLTAEMLSQKSGGAHKSVVIKNVIRACRKYRAERIP
eukprot:3000216-Ditylum_brightwellii.AAC.1